MQNRVIVVAFEKVLDIGSPSLGRLWKGIAIIMLPPKPWIENHLVLGERGATGLILHRERKKMRYPCSLHVTWK